MIFATRSRVARDNPREVHDLGHADCAVLVEETADVGCVELGTGALERRRRDATRCTHSEREREHACCFNQRNDAGHTEDVRDLVRVGRDRGGAVGQHAAHELVDPELGRLEVHVGVDEPGCERSTADVDDLDGVARTPPDDDAVADREVGVDPLPGGGHEDAPAGDEEVGRYRAAGSGDGAGGAAGRLTSAPRAR